MAKAIIAYGSTTGQTELMAGCIALGMKEAGADVTISSATDIDATALLGYDIVVLGSSTWNGLQQEFEPLYEELEDVSLAGKNSAAFGSGDSSYGSAFCEAVDMIEQRLTDRGAKIVTPALKVDGPVEAVQERCREWGKRLASAAMAPSIPD